jgi:hypothetical protein
MREIKLSRNYVMQVDDWKYEQMAKHKWSADSIDGHVYAIRSVYVGHGPSRKKVKIYAHREIMNAKKGEEIGHYRGVGLNNQIENLRRIVDRSHQRVNDKTRADNNSGHRGIRIRKIGSGVRYLVRVSFHGKEYHGGTFRSMAAAVRGHEKKIRELYGGFAKVA